MSHERPIPVEDNQPRHDFSTNIRSIFIVDWFKFNIFGHYYSYYVDNWN